MREQDLVADDPYSPSLEALTSCYPINSLSRLWGEGGRRPGEGQRPTETRPLTVGTGSLLPVEPVPK
jgi:hypothetical protein